MPLHKTREGSCQSEDTGHKISMNKYHSIFPTSPSPSPSSILVYLVKVVFFCKIRELKYKSLLSKFLIKGASPGHWRSQVLKLICARNSRPESMRSRRKTSSMSRLIYYSPPGDVRDHSSPAPKRCRIILLLIQDYFLVALCKTPRRKRHFEWFCRTSKVRNTDE